MVGGLVQQQQVGLFQQHPAERHPAALATRQGRHVGVARRQPEGVHRHVHLVVDLPRPSRVDLVLHPRLPVQQLLHGVVVHGLGELRRNGFELVQQPAHRGEPVLDVPAHIATGIQHRLLGQVANPDARQRTRVSQIVVVHPGHDPEQGRLARAIGADDPDLGTGVERQVDALEDFPGGRNDLPEVAQGEDVFAGHVGKEDKRDMQRAPQRGRPRTSMSREDQLR